MKAVVRTVAILLLVGTALSSAGCSSYWAKRHNDLKDAFDVGLTTSSEPGFSFYVGFLNVLSLGYSNVDGTIHGMAGRETGAVPMRQDAYGYLLWGKERFGYGTFDAANPESPEAWRVGVIGLIQGPRPPDSQKINCPKMFHFGWVGVTLNCKFVQIADLMLGLFTLDIMGDDQRPASAEA